MIVSVVKGPLIFDVHLQPTPGLLDARFGVVVLGLERLFKGKVVEIRA